MRNGPEALMLAEPLKKRTRLDSAQPKDPKAAQPFFTFAETVPASSFDSPQISEALRARLKALVHSQSTSPGPLELSKEQEHASSSELSQQREQYHVVAKTRGRDFDLVDVEANNSSRKRRKAGNAKTRKAENSAKLPDASMEQFNNLLQEYLSCRLPDMVLA